MENNNKLMVVKYWMNKFITYIFDTKETEKQYKSEGGVYKKSAEGKVSHRFDYEMFEVVSDDPNQHKRMCRAILDKYVFDKASKMESLHREIESIEKAYDKIDFGD